MVSRRGIEQAIGVAILALLVAGCFLILRPFLEAILWAVILSYSTWPLYTRLRSYVGGRSALAAVLMIAAVALILVAPIAVLGWSMADQVVRLATVARSWFGHGLPAPPEWLATIPLIGARLSLRWRELSQDGADFAQIVAPHVATVKDTLLSLGGSVANALFELLLSLVIAFFLFCNGVAAGERLASIGEQLMGERGRRLIGVAASTTRGVVESLLGTNLVQAILGAFGFWLAGVPGPILLGFFAFFLTVVPFGGVLVWAPAVLWLLYGGHSSAAIALAIWSILIFGPLENVMRLYFMKRGNQLPALLMLLGMLGGLSAFGFLGVFLGPALLALAYTLIEEWHAPAGAAIPVARS